MPHFPQKVRCSKSIIFFCTISSDFLTSINYMDKWVTPNGVIHLTMLLIDIKILQNHAEKYHRF